jgi:hypothetical protein
MGCIVGDSITDGGPDVGAGVCGVLPMNRLTNYFESAKMAKVYLCQADEDLKVTREARAIRMQGQAIRCLVTAMNNLASIAFHQKPRSGH